MRTIYRKKKGNVKIIIVEVVSGIEEFYANELLKADVCPHL